MLASSALQKIRLYEPAAARHDVEPVYPIEADQRTVMRLITDIKADRHGAAQVEEIGAVVERMTTAGADCVLLACTELSVISSELRTSLPMFDAAEILARVIVRTAQED